MISEAVNRNITVTAFKGILITTVKICGIMLLDVPEADGLQLRGPQRRRGRY